MKSPDQIYSFLNPDIDKLSDPFELPDINNAVERICRARQSGEKVMVHGDYDADGVSATAIMIEGLRKLGIDASYFIPHRILHGYGFGAAGLEAAKKAVASLIITVDCGITSFEAISSANAAGIDVIVTDHHEPVRNADGGYRLPDAIAIVNPKVLNPLIPYLSNLSGAGVAFKLMQALLGGTDEVNEFFDLAAIGTGADVVPLVEDNRIIMKKGLEQIKAGSRIGIRALKNAAGIKSDFFKTSFLYYILIPRINAAGRIASAEDVVKLLITDSEDEAGELAARLHELNAKRQEIEEVVYRDAREMLKKSEILNCEAGAKGAIVLASEGWHPGVVGIVASRLAEEYCMPAFILSIENGIAKGSARSIPSFDIYSGLSKCAGLLQRFGGHKQAAGLALASTDIDRFREAISGVISEEVSDDDFLPSLNIDAAISISDIRMELASEVAMLEPFGYGNEEPLFGARGLEVKQPRVVGNKHLKMHLRQNGRSIDSIGFALGGMLEQVGEMLIDAAFVPIINEWEGNRTLQLNVKAIRPSK
jgi:single-stranded-DNA-specific exonuclease